MFFIDPEKKQLRRSLQFCGLCCNVVLNNPQIDMVQRNSSANKKEQLKLACRAHLRELQFEFDSDTLDPPPPTAKNPI